MQRLSRAAALALVAALAAAPFAAQAAPAVTTFKVTAKVPGTCVVAADSITLDSYDPNAATGATATGNVNLTCTKGTSYTVALSTSSGWKMDDGTGNKLGYEIRQGANTTPWNDTQTVTGKAQSKAQFSLLATLFVAPGQDVQVGTYTDTVTATVNF